VADHGQAGVPLQRELLWVVAHRVAQSAYGHGTTTRVGLRRSGQSTQWLAAAVVYPMANPCRGEGMQPVVGSPLLPCSSTRDFDHACSWPARVVFQLAGLTAAVCP
jgi:hypothetical protein